MGNKIPDKIDVFRIPEHVFSSTMRYLKNIGLQKKEAIAHWTGTVNGTYARVKNTIFPGEYCEQYNTELSASVPLSTAFRIGELVHQRGEILLAQLHTHPFQAFHSWVDNTYPISHRVGFISIVIPYFASDAKKLEDCKVYEYRGSGKWRALNTEEVTQRFVIDTGDLNG